MLVRAVLRTAIMIVALSVAARRVFFLYRMITSGEPSPGRSDNAGARFMAHAKEVLGQRKLLKWSVPGLAHFFVFWGFVLLAFTIIEAVGALYDPDFHIPLVGKMGWFGLMEDFFGLAVLLGL